MPQFAYNTPRHSSDLRAIINRQKRERVTLPVGVIADGLPFQYGYDGDTYWVGEGSLSQLVTTCKMSFAEAKALYDALTFNEVNNRDGKYITDLIRRSRKEIMQSCDLFWFFLDNI